MRGGGSEVDDGDGVGVRGERSGFFVIREEGLRCR